jgi:hypothetical protein
LWHTTVSVATKPQEITMSAKATTAEFAFALHRQQQAGTRFFRDYEEVARRLAAELIGRGA